MKFKYLEILAGVRYWEDSDLNGVEDIDGKMPCRINDCWCPIIDLENGKIINWDNGNTASIHYKVCDNGEYWLLDENKERKMKANNYYVPDGVLVINDNGYGDYIIFDILEDGSLKDYKEWIVREEDWDKINKKG